LNNHQHKQGIEMRKVLIVALGLMNFGTCSAAMATGRDNCRVGTDACFGSCEKIKDKTAAAECNNQCTDGWRFCYTFTKGDERTVKSNAGAGNTKNIPPVGSVTNAGTTIGAASATTNSGVIYGGSGGAIITTNGVTPAVQGSGWVQPIQQQRLRKQN
jgi:hypothetical protein